MTSNLNTINFHSKRGGLCMKGSIYSDQKCPICGKSFVYIEVKKGLFCKKHPEQRASSRFYVKFGNDRTKRYGNDFAAAERHLTGLRFKTDEGTYDARDYQKNRPLAFDNLIKKYLNYKSNSDISPKQLIHYKNVLGKAAEEWGSQNIKEIREGEIEDFLFKSFDGISDKTRHNYKSVLSDFWTWVVRREKSKSGLLMPEFPNISYELGWRTITDVQTQQQIVEEVKRISFSFNPRIWLAIKLLTLYPRIRPGELIDILEGQINTNENWIVIPHPKEGKPKFVHILSEHSKLIELHWEPRGLPHLHFFRHINSRSGIQIGQKFGQRYLRKYWAKACENLGIKGVTLYPGTKHTTVTALGKQLTPEQIKRGATGHVSDAFERYMLPDVNEATMATQAVVEMQQNQSSVLKFNNGGKQRKVRTK
jgi:integrase